MEKKKVVGLSFGRHMSNTEVIIKEALLVCEAAGFDIEFINVSKLKINPCMGCCQCVGQLASLSGSGACFQKDDFPVLQEAFLSSDAMIVGSPVFEFAPTGLFKTVCDRFGPSHDITFVGPAIEAGKKEGRDPATYPDERSMKPRVGALVAVGGARTKNWTALAIPNMFEFTFPMAIDVVDKLLYYGAMNVEHVLGVPEVMAKAKKLGENIVAALNAETEEERKKYRGDEQGTCPVCHEDLLQVLHDGNKVECPVCGIEGTVDVVDGNLKVMFSEAQIKRSRLNMDGKWEHSNEIRDGAMTQKKVEGLKDLKQPYLNVGKKA
jgi:multimeric flavodoxin WrbA